MTSDQWNDLLYAIRKGKCLLLLGAGASTLTKNGVTRPLTEWLALELSEQLRKDQHPIEDSESGSLLYVATEFMQHFKSTVALQREVERFVALLGVLPTSVVFTLPPREAPPPRFGLLYLPWYSVLFAPCQAAAALVSFRPSARNARC